MWTNIAYEFSERKNKENNEIHKVTQLKIVSREMASAFINEVQFNDCFLK